MQITCGRCTKDSGDIVKHTCIDDVRACYANDFSFYEEMLQDEGRAEHEAEMAAERYWEEGTAAQQEQYRWEVEMDERNAAFWAGTRGAA
jgi:hypothetical protein